MTGSRQGAAEVFGVRLHGRGGQGIVTAAELLAVAAFLDGRESQAFPSFGSERMGAPVMSFCRVSPAPIRLREPVTEPDAVVIVDTTLLHQADVFNGLRDDAYVLLNSGRSPLELGLGDVVNRLGEGRILCVPATELARQHLGRPLPNICMLGALAAATALVTAGALEHAVRERFAPELAEANIRAAAAAAVLIRERIHA
jgi:pyruvate ferredoxin oxidoreductase gamma subunit